MMNFENMARKFLAISHAKRISPIAKTLYFELLDYFDKKFFPIGPLEFDNLTMHNLSGLSRKQITVARHELQSLGLISYTNGIGSHSGSYTLIDISNSNINSIVEISNIDTNNEAKIDNLTALSEEVDKLVGDNKLWGQFILRTLQKSIQNNTSGIYANFYATSQLFLKASDTVKFDTLQRIIIHMRFKPDIQNREAYILTIIANEVRQLQNSQKMMSI